MNLASLSFSFSELLACVLFVGASTTFVTTRICRHLARRLTLHHNVRDAVSTEESADESAIGLIQALPFPAAVLSSQYHLLSLNYSAQKTFTSQNTHQDSATAGESAFAELSAKLKDRLALCQKNETTAPLSITVNDSTYDMYVLSLTPVGSTHYGVMFIAKESPFEQAALQRNGLLLSGLMTAGLCHDLNTPLTAISNSLQIIAKRLNADIEKNIACCESLSISMNDIRRYCENRDIFHFIDLGTKALQQTTAMSQNVLSLSKLGSTPTVINLAAAVKECIQLATLVNKNKHLSVEYKGEENPLFVQGVNAELKQGLLNFIINAIQSAEKRHPLTPNVSVVVSMHDDNAKITITDNGHGLPETVKQQLFSQCVTTKENDNGTGLGLPLSYYLFTQRLQGTVSLDNNYNEGCRFVIRLPCVLIRTKKYQEEPIT